MRRFCCVVHQGDEAVALFLHFFQFYSELVNLGLYVTQDYNWPFETFLSYCQRVTLT